MRKKLYITVNPQTGEVVLSPALCKKMAITRIKPAFILISYAKDIGKYCLARVPMQASETMFVNVVSYHPGTKSFGLILGGFHDQLTAAGLLYNMEIYGMEEIDLPIEPIKLKDKTIVYAINKN